MVLSFAVGCFPLVCFGSFLHTPLTFVFNRVLDTLSSAMHSYTIYYFLITNFGNPGALMKATWQVRNPTTPVP